MKTWKIWSVACAMLAVLSLASCGEERDGDWDPMVWHADVPVLRTFDGIYLVSADGETLVFSCCNYSGPWFEGAVDNGGYLFPPYINNPEYPTLQGEHFEAAIHGNKLTITFGPNTDSSARQTAITVTAGDIFYTFQFIQYANGQ